MTEQRMTFPEFLAKITLEEDTRVDQVEKSDEALYNHNAFESNLARATAMEFTVARRRNNAKAYAFLRHRELYHGETYEEEKTILIAQMPESDVNTIEEGVVNYGWWNS